MMDNRMGPHLTVDLRDCKQLLNMSDMESVYEFLRILPDIIGMTPIRRPIVDIWDSKETSRDSGVTGFAAIAESHISVHTYPERQYVFFDMFSCNDFNVDIVVSKVAEWFGSSDFDVNLIWRGKGWDET